MKRFQHHMAYGVVVVFIFRNPKTKRSGIRSTHYRGGKGERIPEKGRRRREMDRGLHTYRQYYSIQLGSINTCITRRAPVLQSIIRSTPLGRCIEGWALRLCCLRSTIHTTVPCRSIACIHGYSRAQSLPD